MFKLGIIGYPLGHSISAVIQKAGLKSIGLDGSYDVMETPPEDLISRIKYIKSNVSADYKLFLKASRSMKFERIIELIKTV